MRFLLDTNLVLWVPISDRRLSTIARSILQDSKNTFVFSTVSIWEIAIKHGLRKASFQVEPRSIRREMLENGYEELALLGEHTLAIDTLPPIHKDPFDRILIAQAMVEGITLLTADAVIARYPGPIKKI